MIKKLLLCYVVLLLTGCASLVPTVEGVKKLENDIVALNTAIDNRQEEVKTRFAEVQSTVDKVNAAIQSSGSVLEAAQNVNNATAPINPYSGVINAVLAGIAALTVGGTGVGVAVNRTRNRESKVKDAKVEEKQSELNRLIASIN